MKSYLDSERMLEQLPTSIKETELLSTGAKKVFAALWELLLHSKARNSQIIYCDNKRLREMSGVRKSQLISYLKELMDYDLITRDVGESRVEGTRSKASEYTINLLKLKEPITEKVTGDNFVERLLLEAGKPSETPMGTPTTITTTTTISTTIPTSTTITTPTATSITKPITTATSKTTTKPTKTKKTNTTSIPSTRELYDECEDISSSSGWLKCLEEPYEEDSDERVIREIREAYERSIEELGFN